MLNLIHSWEINFDYQNVLAKEFIFSDVEQTNFTEKPNSINNINTVKLYGCLWSTFNIIIHFTNYKIMFWILRTQYIQLSCPHLTQSRGVAVGWLVILLL